MTIECDEKHIDSSTNNEVYVPTKHLSEIILLISVSLVLKVGRVAIITRGRYAGKKVTPSSISFTSTQDSRNTLKELGNCRLASYDTMELITTLSNIHLRSNRC